MKKKSCENASLLHIITGILVIACFFLLVWILTNQIKDHYTMFDPKLIELKKKLRKHFPDLLKKVSLHCGEDGSYTLDKKKIYVCLTDENGNYYSDNTLMHVILHELAHVKTVSIGHTPEFHTNFEELLAIAEEKKLYDPNISVPDDYSKKKGACKCNPPHKPHHPQHHPQHHQPY